jgi:hypothetical protein
MTLIRVLFKAFFIAALTMATRSAFAQAACSIQPSGAILQRWMTTGGAAGPLGCPLQAAGGSGRGVSMNFQHGQVVDSSPDQGTAMAVAVYQQGADLFVDWGDSAPYGYDKFIVRWSINGSNAGQNDVPPVALNSTNPAQNPTSYVMPASNRRRGVWRLPLPQAGTYSIVVEGCNNPGLFGTTTCNQSWTPAATITYVPVAPPTGPISTCSNASMPVQPILTRWTSMGAEAGPLGCFLSQTASGSGQVASFSNGQIAWSPDQGPNNTVVVYQSGFDVVVAWGAMSSTFDAFNLLWDKNGSRAPQVEVDPPVDALGNPVAGPFNRASYSIRGVGPGLYNVIVQGCHKGGLLSGSSCTPWTIGAAVHVSYGRDPLKFYTMVPAPFCGGSAANFTISGPILQRWVSLPTEEDINGIGPILGCPTDNQHAIPGTTAFAQDFQNGQIVLSPDQGADMTLALYQQGQDLFMKWGDSYPNSYDKFILLVSNLAQADYTSTTGKISGGSTPLTWHPIAGQGPYPFGQSPGGLIPVNPVPFGQYTAKVEGCNNGLFGSSCGQGWTTPATWNFVSRPPPTADTLPGFKIDFSAIPPSTTPTDAMAQLSARGKIVSQYNACRKTLDNVTKDEWDFMDGAIAKLDLASRGLFCPNRLMAPATEVNAALRFQDIGSSTGSSSTSALCGRQGEYDVALMGYITLVYRYGAFLDVDVRDHIVYNLLDLRGPVFNNDFAICSPANVPETENHLNQMEVSRYLTNQLLYELNGNPLYDNESNGVNDYMLGRLQSFLQNDFLEFNSRPYQSYTDHALENLYDYAKDRRVKTGARLALDYISGKYAASSNFLRRNAPYQRRASQYSDALLDNSDAPTARFTLLSGMYQVSQEISPPSFLISRGYSHDLQRAVASSYSPPGPMLDLLMNATHRNFYQRIQHGPVEIYASRPEYLITAGGIWRQSQYTVLGAYDNDDDAPVLTTTLMPSKHFHDVRDLIRVFGHVAGSDIQNNSQRINTCVAPDFACGFNAVVPQALQTNGCYFVVDGTGRPNGNGPWSFVDFASSGCNSDPDFGFYAAVYAPASGSGGDAVGLFEAHPRDASLTFQQFRTGVLARNGSTVFNASGVNTYVKTSGEAIQFVIPGTNANAMSWSVVGTGNPGLDALGTDITQWPLASGDVLNSMGHSGLVSFDNLGTGERVVLDYTDRGEPRWLQLSRVANPTQAAQVFSMENGGLWSATNATLTRSPLAENAFGSMSVAVSGVNTTIPTPMTATLTSAPMSTSDIRAISGHDLTTLSLNVATLTSAPLAPTPSIQLLFTSVSAGAFLVSLGQVQMTGQPVGQFVHERFSVPTSVLSALAGTHSDVQLSVVLNVTAGTDWILSDLQFGP